MKNSNLIVERIMVRLLEACKASENLDMSMITLFESLSNKGEFQDFSLKYLKDGEFLDFDDKEFLANALLSMFTDKVVEAMAPNCEKGGNKENKSGFSKKGDTLYFSCSDPMYDLGSGQQLQMRIEIDGSRLIIKKNEEGNVHSSFLIDPRNPVTLHLKGFDTVRTTMGRLTVGMISKIFETYEDRKKVCRPGPDMEFMDKWRQKRGR